MLINKEIVKEIALRPCLRLSYLLCNEKYLINLYKKLIENKVSIDDVNERIDLDSTYETIYEFLRLNDDLYESIKEKFLDNEDDLTKLILKMQDFNEVSRLSMRYYELLYPKQVKRADTVDGSIDGVKLIAKSAIEANTLKYLNDEQVKVIFEGQITYNDQYLARWDILLKEGKKLHLIEVKGTKNVYKNINKTVLKNDYYFDLLFQYYVYKAVLTKLGFSFASLNFLTLNSEFMMQNESKTYPLNDKYLSSFFAPLTSTINAGVNKEEIEDISLLKYMDSNLDVILPLLDFISKGATMNTMDESEMKYHCRHCMFLLDCHKRCDYPKENNIFSLTNEPLVGGNYRKTTKLIEEEKIKSLIEISKGFIESNYPKLLSSGYLNIARMQIEFASNQETELVDIARLNELVNKDYSLYPLIFFDFETFTYPVPIINKQKPYEQICSQYSMHVVKNDYDIKRHDFDAGTGGNITHYEFIGDPKTDQVNNPELSLIKTLIAQFEKENIDYKLGKFTLVTYNKDFEMGRFKNMMLKYPEYAQFLSTCYNRCVDLRNFFTSGYWYRKDFNGKTSLKIVSPSFKNDPLIKEYYQDAIFDLEKTLNYKSDDNVIHNGSEALETYQTLIRAVLSDNISDKLHDETLKGLLYYCKKDSWGTVVIFDIIINTIKNKINRSKILNK